MGTSYSTATSVKSKTDFYTWRPDANDIDDEYVRYRCKPVSKNLKRVVDNVHHCGPVLNQGKLGSCTANAIAGAYTYRYNLEHNTNSTSSDEFLPSRLFIYYNERNMEGTTKEDSGAQIKDGIKSVNVNGVCPESMWPYDITKFTDKPTEDCYVEAKKDHHSVKQHRVIKSLDSLKGCLETGRVFVFGFVVFESFEDQTKWNGDVMPLPTKGEQVLGGHAVLCVGYDDFKGCFKVRNSWGAEWGNNGDFYMPYEFMTGVFNVNDYNTTESYWETLKVVEDEDITNEEKNESEDNDTITKVDESKPVVMEAAYCSDLWSIDLTYDTPDSDP